MLYNYEKTSINELSVKRSEKVEIIDDSSSRWYVKNRMGEQGYVPASYIEPLTPISNGKAGKVIMYFYMCFKRLVTFSEFIPCIVQINIIHLNLL